MTIRNLKCLGLTYNGQQSLPRHTVAFFLEGQRPVSKFHAHLLNTCMCGLFAPPPTKPVLCFFNSVMLGHEYTQEDLVTFGYRSAMEVEIYENPVISSVAQLSLSFVKLPIPILTVIFKISLLIKGENI